MTCPVILAWPCSCPFPETEHKSERNSGIVRNKLYKRKVKSQMTRESLKSSPLIFDFGKFVFVLSEG